MSAADYSFSADWFSHVAPIWEKALKVLLPAPKKIVEVGSYEGRSTIWMIENAFPRGEPGLLYCIDTWAGGAEHDPAAMPQVEERFDSNIARARKQCPSVAVHKIKNASDAALLKMVSDGHQGSVDLMYIDGSHQASDVLTDLVLGFMLCRLNGIIVCDDYLWKLNRNPLLNPKLAIDAFTNCFFGKIEPVNGIPLYQLWLRKTAP
jgi:hypothetical protein